MCEWSDIPRGDAERLHCRCILTLLEAGLHRDLVRRSCAALAPASCIVEVGSATDAVLTLLGEPVDMVLIDAALAGDLLGVLRRHVQRSAPHARLALFANGVAAGGASVLSGALPWSQLDTTLRSFLLAD